MRYRLRTLLIALALLPPLLAGGWIWGWREYAELKHRQEQLRQRAELEALLRQELALEQANRVGPLTNLEARLNRAEQSLEEAKSPMPEAPENSD